MEFDYFPSDSGDSNDYARHGISDHDIDDSSINPGPPFFATKIPELTGFEGFTDPPYSVGNSSSLSTVMDGDQTRFTDFTHWLDPAVTAPFSLGCSPQYHHIAVEDNNLNSDCNYSAQEWTIYDLRITDPAPPALANINEYRYYDDGAPNAMVEEFPVALQSAPRLSYRSPSRPIGANPTLLESVGNSHISPYVPSLSVIFPHRSPNRDSTSPQPSSSSPSSPPTATPQQLHHHQRRHLCPYPPCDKRFRRNGDRMRHIRSSHSRPPVEELYQCPVEGCKRRGQRGFVRRDKLECHVRAKHGGGRL
ncbi:MAG: hypothetical protein M1839_006582 [Geoglossum umbratile]|nr:MAG: hypothetical protein M1839_006582 [Geoglossum umbratile]